MIRFDNANSVRGSGIERDQSCSSIHHRRAEFHCHFLQHFILIDLGAAVFAQSLCLVVQARVDSKPLPNVITFITMDQIGGWPLRPPSPQLSSEPVDQQDFRYPIDVPRAAVQATIAGAGSTLLKGLDSGTRARLTQAIIESMSRVSVLGIRLGL